MMNNYTPPAPIPSTSYRNKDAHGFMCLTDEHDFFMYGTIVTKDELPGLLYSKDDEEFFDYMTNRILKNI